MTKKILSALIILTFVFTSCTSHRKIEPDDDFAVEADSEMAPGNASASGDELSLDDLDSSTGSANAANDLDQELENELNNLDASTAQTAPSNSDELSLDEPLNGAADDMALSPAEPAPIADIPPQEPPFEEPVAPPMAEAPVPTPSDVPALSVGPAAKINTVDYQANTNGGTVVIAADQPLRYTTRMNSTTNQFVVEVENSVIPDRLKRPLNTKDMASPIGSVDIYQKTGSNVSRFVVQLRPGASEPFVQPEGNSLLIIGGGLQAAAPPPAPVPMDLNTVQPAESSTNVVRVSPNPDIVDLYTDGIMSSDNLEEFLISNNKFYGKKISIETNKMDIRDAFKFLAEESGINIIMDDGLTGDVSLKLRDVPWDQAFILLLKSKKLGFKRQGNVMRIARIEDIKSDEDEAIRMLEDRKNKAPLVVRRFFIGYANIEELEKKISQFLTTTNTLTSTRTAAGATAAAPVASSPEAIGKIISDKRTNSLIVTDTEENMARIEKLIVALDTQPAQVLIEGKVVEAKEEFARGLGIVWDSTPSTTGGSRNTVDVGVDPALPTGFSVLNTAFTWGQLDVLGSLSARLQLGEREDKVRVLSSPRISVLSNEKATIAQTAGLLIPKVETDTAGQTTRSFEIVQVGVTLNVTPQVSNEGTVTLDMDIDRSFLSRVDSNVPDKRNAKTKVIVKSGETAVIGGIFESEAREASSGVPGLQNIPILGRLFRGDRDGKSKNELVIFVTPTILKPVVGSEPRSGTF